MNVHKRYKMYKKGKKWCCMALTTFVAILGVLTTTEIANADIVTDPDQVALVSSTKTTIANENSSSADLNTTSENVPESGQKSDVSQAIFSSSKSASISSDNASNSSVENIASDSKAIQSTEAPTANQVSPVSDTEKNKAILDSTKNSNVEAVSMTSLPASTIKNGLETENTNTYYYENGQQLKNAFKNINGKMYYFNPNGVMAKDYFYKNWGHTYYFQKDGSRLDDGFYNNWGNTYYFGNGGVRLDDGFYSNWGHMYYFGDGGVRLDNGFYNNWGNTYYFGNGGVRLDNSFYNNWENLYYFGSDGSLQKNRQVSVNLTNYWANNDGVLTPQFDNGVNRYIINNHIGHASITYYNAIPENITGTYSGTSDGRPNMIVVHETANPNDSIWGEINYEKSHYNSAFVHAFVDNNSIIQISNTDHEAWGAAYPANGRAVQFEQVEVYGGWNFAAELVNAAYYTAYKMKQYGMYPRIADGDLNATLWSHHDVSRYLGGTDHTDPDSYWSNRAWTNFGTGYGMWDFTMLVNYEYALLQ
ncbi:N-acetylmuramoyl-L-alanine amidase [Limosilactobacillus mucosae]